MLGIVFFLLHLRHGNGPEDLPVVVIQGELQAVEGDNASKLMKESG
jgi:hypothetical protein